MKLMCLESDDQWLLTLQKKRWKKLKRHSYEIIHHHRGSSFENSGKKIKSESDQASWSEYQSTRITRDWDTY